MPKPNPFTPKSGWEQKIFAGRKDEFEFLDKKIGRSQKWQIRSFSGSW
jgi:hypothetical protein